MMGNDFLQITSPADLAAFFDLTYEELASVIYGMDEAFRYSEFRLPKRAGGYRTIKVPCRRLKAIQRRLSDALYTVHEPRASAHGFLKGRSVVTNAGRHLHKSYVFNIDLEGYFDSIHRGRVKGLFAAPPFRFPSNVATVLAQICCFDDTLPQGAPTSPIVANMVSRKLDRQLEELARTCKATYTRYADDLTFSFNCSRSRLPRAVVDTADGTVLPGRVLTRLVEDNGFKINYSKVRLAGSSQRKAVTGVTVNQFPNVPRAYVKQIRSQLHAWKVFGYKAAESEFNEKYDRRHRATEQPKSLLAVILGKMAYLKCVRGPNDSVYVRLAEQYNELVGDNGPQLWINPRIDDLAAATDSLWVLYGWYHKVGETDISVEQGTGFMLAGGDLVTCAHCVLGQTFRGFEEITAHNRDDSQNYSVSIDKVDLYRDVAVCSLVLPQGEERTLASMELCDEPIRPGLPLTLLGFPNHPDRASHYEARVNVARVYDEGVRFDIDHQIFHGNSGGPLVNGQGKVVGMAQKGLTDDGSGTNSALSHHALRAFLERAGASPRSH